VCDQTRASLSGAAARQPTVPAQCIGGHQPHAASSLVFITAHIVNCIVRGLWRLSAPERDHGAHVFGGRSHRLGVPAEQHGGPRGHGLSHRQRGRIPGVPEAHPLGHQPVRRGFRGRRWRLRAGIAAADRAAAAGRLWRGRALAAHRAAEHRAAAGRAASCRHAARALPGPAAAAGAAKLPQQRPAGGPGAGAAGGRRRRAAAAHRVWRRAAQARVGCRWVGQRACCMRTAACTEGVGGARMWPARAGRVHAPFLHCRKLLVPPHHAGCACRLHVCAARAACRRSLHAAACHRAGAPAVHGAARIQRSHRRVQPARPQHVGHLSSGSSRRRSRRSSRGRQPSAAGGRAPCCRSSSSAADAPRAAAGAAGGSRRRWRRAGQLGGRGRQR
jgi:hypothetical protein